MLDLHPEFLKKNGRTEFVVLPYEEFLRLQELLEDAEDLLDLRRAREENAGQPGMPLDEAMKRYVLAE